MPVKARALDDEKTSSTHKSSKLGAEDHSVLAQQQSQLTTIVRRIKQNPRLLSSQDVLQLQRTFGNQAVGRLLTGKSPISPNQLARRTNENTRGIDVGIRGTPTSVHAGNVIQRLKHTQGDIQTALANGTISSHLIGLYNLQYRHHNDEVIFLTAPAQQDAYMEAANTQYWYRAMTPDEFDMLNRNNRFFGDSYGGIAPNRQYVRGYFTNNSEGTHIIEFRTPGAGYLHGQFSPKILEWGGVKAEGGGTYGLGPTGNGKGAAGAAFNNLLARGMVTWELVDLRIKNTLP